MTPKWHRVEQSNRKRRRWKSKINLNSRHLNNLRLGKLVLVSLVILMQVVGAPLTEATSERLSLWDQKWHQSTEMKSHNLESLIISPLMNRQTRASTSKLGSGEHSVMARLGPGEREQATGAVLPAPPGESPSGGKKGDREKHRDQREELEFKRRLFELKQKYKTNRAISDRAYYTLLVIYSLFIIIGTVSNSLVCLTVILKPKILSPRNIFIVNLAGSDLLLCVFTMPFSFIEISMKMWHMGSIPCKLVAGLQATSIFVSTISITAIALDRYKVIVYQTHQEPANGFKGTSLLLGSVWAGALLLSSPLFRFRTVEHMTLPHKYDSIESIEFCVEAWPFAHGRGIYSVISMILQYVLPITIVSVVYLKISDKLQKRLIRRQKLTQLEWQQKRQLNLIRRTHTILISVSLIFGLSWLPLNLLNVIGDFSDLFKSDDQLFRIVFAICHLIGCSSACTNPILYAYLNENFRKEAQQVYAYHARSLLSTSRRLYNRLILCQSQSECDHMSSSVSSSSFGREVNSNCGGFSHAHSSDSSSGQSVDDQDRDNVSLDMNPSGVAESLATLNKMDQKSRTATKSIGSYSSNQKLGKSVSLCLCMSGSSSTNSMEKCELQGPYVAANGKTHELNKHHSARLELESSIGRNSPTATQSRQMDLNSVDDGRRKVNKFNKRKSKSRYRSRSSRETRWPCECQCHANERSKPKDANETLIKHPYDECSPVGPDSADGCSGEAIGKTNQNETGIEPETISSVESSAGGRRVWLRLFAINRDSSASTCGQSKMSANISSTNSLAKRQVDDSRLKSSVKSAGRRHCENCKHRPKLRISKSREGSKRSEEMKLRRKRSKKSPTNCHDKDVPAGKSSNGRDLADASTKAQQSAPQRSVGVEQNSEDTPKGNSCYLTIDSGERRTRAASEVSISHEPSTSIIVLQETNEAAPVCELATGTHVESSEDLNPRNESKFEPKSGPNSVQSELRNRNAESTCRSAETSGGFDIHEMMPTTNVKESDDGMQIARDSTIARYEQQLEMTAREELDSHANREDKSTAISSLMPVGGILIDWPVNEANKTTSEPKSCVAHQPLASSEISRCDSNLERPMGEAIDSESLAKVSKDICERQANSRECEKDNSSCTTSRSASLSTGSTCTCSHSSSYCPLASVELNGASVASGKTHTETEAAKRLDSTQTTTAATSRSSLSEVICSFGASATGSAVSVQSLETDSCLGMAKTEGRWHRSSLANCSYAGHRPRVRSLNAANAVSPSRVNANRRRLACQSSELGVEVNSSLRPTVGANGAVQRVKLREESS